MREKLKQCVYILSLMAVLFEPTVAKAQDDSTAFLVKGDLFGLVASLPSNEYLKVSPEIELMPGKWASVSITFDFEYYRGITHVQNSKLAQQYGFVEFFYGRDYRTEASFRVGFRKYFLNDNKDKVTGFFGEIQTGVSWNKRDSIYDLLDQYGAYQQENIYPEARVRLGYQDKLSSRFLYAFSIEGDVRRILTNEKWFRWFVPEFNLIFKF